MNALDTLIAKQEIRDVLSRYCRGLDRMDKEMAEAVWHEDGTANYLEMYEGTGRGFVDWVWEAHAAMQCHSHQITNVLIEVDGDRATSEAYVTVVLWTKPGRDGRQREILVRGRYLDRWERRQGSWAIGHRTHVVDTQTVSKLEPAPVSAASARDESDPSFAFIPKAGRE